MDMNELQFALSSAISETTLACIIQKEPITMTQRATWKFGACDLVPWMQLHATAHAVVRLASDVLAREESEFGIQVGCVEEGGGSRVRYGIHIELQGSDASSRSTFQQALGPFLKGILEGADCCTLEMFPAEILTDILQQKVSANIAETLSRLGGRKLKVPLEIISAKANFSIGGKYAEAPRQEIDQTPFDIVGRIESLGRPDRKFTILTPGTREHLRQVHFDIDKFLSRFRNILCDDRIYRFTVHFEMDAKGKSLLVVDKVTSTGEEQFALTS